MMVRAYLEWLATASAQERAEAVAMLAEVYLGAELSADDRRDAEAALMMALEDGSPLVRRAMAEALGAAELAPRPIVAALARDQADVAAVIIANSPLLTDIEIIDIVAFGPSSLQLAASLRPHVSPELAGALAISCGPEAAVALLGNAGAEVPLDSLRLLTERHGGDGSFREAMLAREDVPPEISLTLAVAVAKQLSDHVASVGWLTERRAERLRTEATESAAITVALTSGEEDMLRIAVRLRESGHLTPQLLLRAVLSGEIRLFVASLADLAEVDMRRAQGFVLGRSMMGFGALYRKAGLPRTLEPAFAAAVAGWQELSKSGNVAEGRLSRVMIEMVLSAVALIDGPEVGRLRAVLMTYQSEAARDEARLRIANILAAEPVVEMASPPQMDDLNARLEDALALELQQAA